MRYFTEEEVRLAINNADCLCTVCNARGIQTNILSKEILLKGLKIK